MHRWWVFLHIAGVFGFLMAHGVSAYVTLRLRKEREPARVRQLLELSSSSVGVMWNSIGLLLLGGIVAGFTGHFWGQAWIWVAIAVFLAVLVAMYAMGTTWASRLRTISTAMAEGTEAVSQEQFEGLLRSKRPVSIAAIGFAGLVVILWLMIFKPTFGLGGDPCAPDGAIGRTGFMVCASNDQAFDRSTITVPAGSPFQLGFDNEDEGVQHNVSIYTDDSAKEPLFVGELVTGPTTVSYDVPALESGVYYFRCDVHPQMDGTLEAA